MIHFLFTKIFSRKPTDLHLEPHARGGGIVRDLVYAAHDGIITTFAIVAGVVGAALPQITVIILGLANLVADGISMAFGNYLGIKSEQDFVKQEEARERKEIHEMPEIERQEIREIFSQKGFSGEILEKIVETITQDEQRWLEVMMREELGLQKVEQLHPVRNGLVTFVAFFGAGFIPLIAFFIPIAENLRFLAAIVFTGLALFLVGSARTYVTQKNPILSGLQMLVVGSISALAAYLIGRTLEELF